MMRCHAAAAAAAAAAAGTPAGIPAGVPACPLMHLCPHRYLLCTRTPCSLVLISSSLTSLPSLLHIDNAAFNTSEWQDLLCGSPDLHFGCCTHAVRVVRACGGLRHRRYERHARAPLPTNSAWHAPTRRRFPLLYLKIFRRCARLECGEKYLRRERTKRGAPAAPRPVRDMLHSTSAARPDVRRARVSAQRSAVVAMRVVATLMHGARASTVRARDRDFAPCACPRLYVTYD